MAKVFLDVGAHLGETLAVALEPRWGFDRIYCFEPAAACWPALEAMADDRVTICRYGLWDHDARVPLHDPGEIGASMLAAKAVGTEATEVEVRDAAEWFAEHLTADDEVVVKVNCEGAECDVLDRLMESGEIAKVSEAVIHWDVRKVAGAEHREGATRARLDQLAVPYRNAEEILFGGNTREKTQNWLAHLQAGPVGRFRRRRVNAIAHRARVWVYDLRHRA